MNTTPIRLRWTVLVGAVLWFFWLEPIVSATEIIPPLARLQPGRPRLLLRPDASPGAVAVADVRGAPTDPVGLQMLAQLRAQKSPAAQAMVWLLTGEATAAERAVATLRAYRYPGEVDTFHVYFTLTQFALAYDWLHDWEGFTPEIRAEVRGKVRPLAQHGLQVTDDHMFHNYIWMSAGGVFLWALATAGEDEPSNQLFDRIRQRFNEGLFPAWKYLDGLPSEPMGYWSLYVLTPGILTLLAAQSAFGTDVFGPIRQSDGDWLNRHFENLVQCVLPDGRYIPWGDLQEGPNGGVTREMAGLMDAATWATRSGSGAFLSQRLATQRGLRRFDGDTPIYYFLYTRRLQVQATPPPLSFLAGNEHGGHFIARSSWEDDATIVAFRATDHFGDHHHYDQGSFLIYRRGLLAVDPPIYRQVRGPQQATAVHNTLLLGGQPQRPVRGQWFKTIGDFQKNLTAGRQLETGDILFSKEAGAWAAVAGQFAQAYSPTQVSSCVRQMLLVRPGLILVVDQLLPPTNGSLPEVQWLLQLPVPPILEGRTFHASLEKSWLRCRPLSPGGSPPSVEPTPVKTQRVSLRYQSNGPLNLAHLLEVGDGSQPGAPAVVSWRETSSALEATLDGQTFSFSTQPPFGVTKP